MIDGYELKQTQLGKESTQIGVQNNEENHYHIGLSLEDASQIAINLFMDNFPKLQEKAIETVKERVEEFCSETIDKLSKQNTTDFSAFTDPDVQYVLYKAEENYARFGTKEKLDALSSLIANRVKYNDDSFNLKIAIDEAIKVAGKVTEEQLNYLSLLFITTRVKMGNINSINDLRNHFFMLNSAFPIADTINWENLQMLGCLELQLPDICKMYAKRYNLDEAEVKTICPENIKKLSGDYSVSPIGIVLAIINAEAKTVYRFNPNIWIN